MLGALTSVDPEIALTRNILDQSGVLAAFLFGCVVLGVGAWLLAESLGWYRIPSTLAAVGLSLAVAVTLIQPGGHLPNLTTNSAALCLRDQFSLHGGLQVLNLLMLMPFALCATLATRRPIVVAITSAALSATIELIQAWTGLGVCQKQDFLNNSLGAALAALAGWLVLLALGVNRVRTAAQRANVRQQ